jgi:acyl-CoA reductase-like NAD-dependent aldehyde dehydrogenase
MEIEPLKSDIAGTLDKLENWTKPESTKAGMAFMLDSTEIVHEPFGVVLIIGPWNYPVQLTLWPLLGAIAAGNCVIIKPSEVAVNTSQILAERLPEYLDKECFHVMPGGVEIATALLKQRFDYIFYTGNSTVGRIVMRAAAEHLTPVTLELGGKGPCVVDSNSNIPTVARRVFFGKMLNAGQTCIAPDYILCDKETQERLVEALKPVIKEFLGEVEWMFMS